mmetsp:Transcript_155581/g.497450  ORF Transcript_155581/g.497450 Transcript_155581/m.497450 type:complete len:207 (+) Transcript_155581:85-705(+)
MRKARAMASSPPAASKARWHFVRSKPMLANRHLASSNSSTSSSSGAGTAPASPTTPLQITLENRGPAPGPHLGRGLSPSSSPAGPAAVIGAATAGAAPSTPEVDAPAAPCSAAEGSGTSACPCEGSSPNMSRSSSLALRLGRCPSGAGGSEAHSSTGLRFCCVGAPEATPTPPPPPVPPAAPAAERSAARLASPRSLFCALDSAAV